MSIDTSWQEQPSLDVEYELRETRPEVPDFGIWHLSINEAAKLVAQDMFYQGVIYIESSPLLAEKNIWGKVSAGMSYEDAFNSEPEVEELENNDPRIVKLLEEHTEKLRLGLKKAINAKRIEAFERRDIEGNLNTGKTLLNFNDLCGWLGEIDYDYGDAINEYIGKQMELYAKLHVEFKYLTGQNQQDLNQLDLKAFVKTLINENNELKRKLYQQPTNTGTNSKPLHPKERGSLLRVIAALLATPRDKPFDIYSPSAVSILEQMTINADYPISDDTARKIINQLKNIPPDK